MQLNPEHARDQMRSFAKSLQRDANTAAMWDSDYVDEIRYDIQNRAEELVNYLEALRDQLESEEE